MMELKDIIGITQSLGFPILLVIWFILRTERIIERNTDALHNLAVIEGRELEVLRALTGKDLDTARKFVEEHTK